jgi:CheY-like chemotaxis protein
MLLSSLDYEIVTASDAASTIAMATQHQPDVILLDIGLPGANGYEVARMLRRLPGLANVRLIALTGYGSARDRQRALEAGFDNHLTKPVSTKLLLECIESGN